MAYCDLQVLNRPSILLATLLLIVPAVICQMPSCGFGAIDRHFDYNEKTMKMHAGELTYELEIMKDYIFYSTKEYLETRHLITNLENFNDLWVEPHKLPLLEGIPKFQDRPNMNHTDLVQAMYIPFNRILHYFTRTESSQISTNTVDDTDTQKINKIRSHIKRYLQKVMCAMYKYLASVDGSLHIESSNKIENLLDTGKDGIQNELKYCVYLTQTLEQLINSTDLFANS